MRLEKTVHPVLRPWNPDILLNEFPLPIHLGTKTFFTQENICKSSSKPRDPSQHLKVDQRQGFLAKAEKLRDGFGETSAVINFPDCFGGGRGATEMDAPESSGQARRCSAGAGDTWLSLQTRRAGGRPPRAPVATQQARPPSARAIQSLSGKRQFSLYLHPESLMAWHANILGKHRGIERKARKNRRLPFPSSYEIKSSRQRHRQTRAIALLRSPLHPGCQIYCSSFSL